MIDREQGSAAGTPPFRSLLEQAPDGIVYTDCNGTIRFWNAAAERVFGYAEGEVVGSSVDVIIPERFRSAHWRGFQKAVESGDTRYAGRVLTTRAVHKEGRDLYVDLAFSLVKDEAGAVIGVLANARDCTESFLTQKTLRARVAELERSRNG